MRAPAFALHLLAAALAGAPPPLQFNTSQVGPTWALLRAHSPLTAPALAAVTAAADRALQAPPYYSVTNKTALPPSGDRHDYMSVGVYWWPCTRRAAQACACNATYCAPSSPTCDPATGLPWVSCDGHVNHAAVAGLDQPQLAGLASAVAALAQGFYWTREEAYAARAASLLRAWFLDPATRMNPNLNFGQAFPGVLPNGSFSGLIEADGNLIQLLDAVALLQAEAPCSGPPPAPPCAPSPAWTTADAAGLRAWLSQWSAWLATSPFSETALAFFNNHQTWLRGSWGLVSAWLGDTARGVALLNGAKSALHAPICEQIGAGGELPAEEARVNSIGYVLMDATGLLNLAGSSRYAPFVAAGGGAAVGDLYTFVCPSGNHSSIQAALQYLIPFALGERAWPYPTETQDFSGLSPLLRQLGSALHNATYHDIAARIPGASASDLSLLWWRADAPPAALELHVDCTLHTSLVPSPATPTLHTSLASAQAALRAHLAASPATPATGHIRGPCPSSALRLTAADSGPVTWRPATGLPSFSVTGGSAIPLSALPPVTDPAILARFPPLAQPHVRALDLRGLGLDPGPAPIAGRQCRGYAEGLPEPHGGSMPSAAINSPMGLEFFAASGVDSAPQPLRLAAYPNQPAPPSTWSHVLHSTTQGPFNRTFGPDLPTLARAAAWAAQFASDPGSIYVHEYCRLGWCDMHWRLEGLSAHNMTFGGCGNMSIGEHSIQTGNYFYAYNIAAELDSPSEYYINRTEGVLYVWLPQAPPPAAPPTTIVGYVSMQEAPLLDLQGVAGHSWVNASFLLGRGVGVSAVDCADLEFSGVEVASVGLMGVNVSGGTGVAFRSLSVHDTGNGGVYLYAGDRVTLTPAGHVVEGCSITRYNRVTHCYTPGAVLGGVGNAFLNCSIYDAPHQAIFLSGNDHTIADCDISLVTQITADSGAFYMGRDVSYRGNRLLRNAWHDINSVYPGTPALYLDDCASSVTVINNSFRNCSGPTAASEGGKAHQFIGNYIGEDAQPLHVVGKSCAGALPYLSAVPWNTSAAWLAAYPEMVPELAEDAGAPWHLVLQGNTRCAPRANSSAAAPFADIGAQTVEKYNGSDDGGVNACWGEGAPPPWVAQPVRGWNSWTAFGCGVTDADLRETADALVAKGLAAAGYTIVAPDECVGCLGLAPLRPAAPPPPPVPRLFSRSPPPSPCFPLALPAHATLAAAGPPLVMLRALSSPTQLPFPLAWPQWPTTFARED